jgi:predicted phage terminase large subunit-like protein
MTATTVDPREALLKLQEAARSATTDAEAKLVTHQIAALTRRYRTARGIGIPAGPVEQAQEIDPAYRIRPHTAYLNDVIECAVRDVEGGRNRYVAVSLPPRVGKSTLISHHLPAWALRKHPEWKVIMTSYDHSLAVGFGRAVRRTIEENARKFGMALASDVKAAGEWETLDGGGMLARSYRSGITGRGAKVLIIDDPIKDFVEAHSKNARDAIWNWWLSTAYTRLEAPFLVFVVMTRWHEDDFIGRLLSHEYEGNPADWEVVRLPALALDNDPLGRAPGEPLFSPLVEQTADEAKIHWEQVRSAVGGYTFNAMYQQAPSPAKGSIFDTSWWRYWTDDPNQVSRDEDGNPDGRVIWLDPAKAASGRWLDSWDMAFKKAEDTDYVVGQRWVRIGVSRYLIDQQRGRWSFTESLDKVQNWGEGKGRFGRFVHERIVEDKANGPAVVDVLKEKVPGLITVSPGSDSKEARARAVTPEVEAGQVLLPHPSMPGYSWVTDYISELREFPHGANDDQVDGTSQALNRLRDPGHGSISVPGRQRPTGVPRDIARAAATQVRRVPGR